MLRIAHPPGYPEERAYIFRVLLQEFLGLDFQCVVESRSDIRITQAGDPDGVAVTVADVLFQTPAAAWLTQASLPGQPLSVWNLTGSAVAGANVISSAVPVIFGVQRPVAGSFCQQDERVIALGLDIFGSAFFLLTRYEEAVKPDRDKRDRFPGAASLAYQEGFLERPIVNEYLEILWTALQQFWPGLPRQPRLFRTFLSHDVDWPTCSVGGRLLPVLKNVAGDVLRRKAPGLAARRLLSYAQVRRGNRDGDLCNTFDFIMDLSERQGLQSAFYFITDHTAGDLDGVYSMDDPWILSLLRRIHARGHEIGLHPSYHTYQDPVQLQREFARLRATAAAEGIDQAEWGGRQHFLRWDACTTWRAWADAGLAYDSTLTYADVPGFRTGTCYEYPTFDLVGREPLALRERPLTVMEATLLDHQYCGLTPEQAYQCIHRLRGACRRFAGDFALLWHNSQLVLPEHARLYREVVAAAPLGS